jgi:holo-[acyl-carrier protein] synthase
VRVGVDLIEIERIRRALARYGDDFKDRCFTKAERDYCDSKPNPPQHYAGRFAAKEAVGKALGSGVYFTWKEIEIRGRPKPGVHLEGRTAAWADRAGVARVELSMTHSRELAAAVAVAVDDTSGRGGSPPEPGSARREAS